MVSVASLLVVVCVAVGVSADDGSCTTKHIRQITDDVMPLTPVTLTPGIADWEVNLPQPCDVAGYKVTVCDYDVAPSLKYKKFDLVFVHRKGHLQGYATVTGVVYCNDSYDSSVAGVAAASQVTVQAPKNVVSRPY